MSNPKNAQKVKSILRKIILIISFVVISTTMVLAQQAKQSLLDFYLSNNFYYNSTDLLKNEILNFVYETKNITPGTDIIKSTSSADLDKAFESRLSNFVGSWLIYNYKDFTTSNINPNGSGRENLYITIKESELPEIRLSCIMTFTKTTIKEGNVQFTYPPLAAKWSVATLDKGKYNSLSLRLKDRVNKIMASYRADSNNYFKKAVQSYNWNILYVSKDLIILGAGQNAYPVIWIREATARKLMGKALEKRKALMEGKLSVEEILPKQVKPKREVFVAVEQSAEFPGGNQALNKYLSENIKYPEEAVQDDIQGRVIVQVIVEADGSIKEAEILKGVSELLDKEAIRVVKAMPKWAPGKNNGVPVASYFRFPVVFKLPN